MGQPSERHRAIALDALDGVIRRGDFIDRLALAFEAFEAEVRREERERCARIAEEHQEHVDFSDPQDHVEPPFRCNVAEAIRGADAAGK